VLTGLDAARERLFAEPDERRVGTVDAPGSSAYAYDLAAVRALHRDGAAARGAGSDLTFLRVRQAGQWRADLEVVDTLRKHTIVRVTGGNGARPGAVLEVRPAPAPRHSVLSLVRTDQGWRVAAVGPP
jgi:hypothetical protein